jgi:hypothetical protein
MNSTGDHYLNKYKKYKSKYLKLKSAHSFKAKTGGGKFKCIGINYEAGKIINHILKYKNCVGYANIQVAMDAPYAGRVADETVREKGRSESQYKKYGYDENQLISEVFLIFNYIKEHYPDVKIIIQIARGKAAQSTFDEIINPVLSKLEIKLFDIKFGYRSTDYYVPTTDDKFVFVNYGMFAVLSNIKDIRAGQICNPCDTYTIVSYNEDTGFVTDKSKQNYELDKMNILSRLGWNYDINLYGIADDMPFIVPDVYKEEHIMRLIYCNK